MRALAFLFVLGLAACSVELPCSPEGCPHGCCDASGICQLGTQNTACGRAGACEACGKGVCDPETRTCGIPLKPQVMFLVTHSGSTAMPANLADPACPANCSPNCPAACATRLGAIKSALGAFLPTHGVDAWYSLAAYPTRSGFDACGATTSADVLVPFGSDPADLDSALQSRASTVSAQVQGLTSSGGSPAGPSLKFLAGDSKLTVAKRKTWVVLFVAGLPNCNVDNPNTCSGSNCQCTISTCTGTFCATGCLDDAGTAAAVAALKAKGVKTAVIGVGGDVKVGAGPAALDTIANASEFRRQCKASADCGEANSCNGGVCLHSYYLASTPNELALALAAFAGQVLPYESR